MNTINLTQKEMLSGRVRCQVVDSKTGKVKRDYGWQKNLILNQGLDTVVLVSYFAPVTTVLFNQNQTKSGSFLLALEYQLNWSRTF